MSDSFEIKAGDTSPALRYALMPASVNLTDATVRFRMRLRGGATVIDEVAQVVIATGTPTVEFAWRPGDTDEHGFYVAEFRVIYANGRIETFPNVGFIEVPIAEGVPAVGVLPLAVNISLPAITGSAIQGQTLTASAGTWTNSPTSYAYQWRRSGTAIGGATSGTYTLQAADVGATITVQVVAINARGSSAPAVSAATATVTATSVPVPVNTSIPTITGSAIQGQTLTASPGVWTNSPASYAYQWRRGGTPISGATSGTYTLQVADVGVTITVQVIATNPGGDSAPALSAGVVPVVGAQQATQGNVSFRYSGPVLQTFNAFDGSAGIVVPDAGNVPIAEVTPPRVLDVQLLTDIDSGPGVNMQLVPYDISGVETDPAWDLDHPFDERLAGQYNAARLTSFPATLTPNQTMVKYVSDPALLPANVRKGVGTEIATLHVVGQTQFNTMQAAGGIANWLPKAPVTWTGRSGGTGYQWRPVNMEAVRLARPNGGAGLSLSGITLPSGITLAEEVIRLNRPNAGLLMNNATTAAGYEGHSLFNYGAPTSNYGRDAATRFRYLAAHYIGNTAWSTIAPAIGALAALGSHFFDLQEGKVLDQGVLGQRPDGGHWQFMWAPMIWGLIATGRASRIADIPTLAPMNQCGQPFLLSAANVLELAPHTDNAKCYTYRHRAVTLVEGNILNVQITAADPTWCKWDSLMLMRAADNTFVAFVQNMPGVGTSSGEGSPRQISMDRDISGLISVGESVYFAAPPGWPLSAGDPVWSIDGTMKNFSPSPESEYRSLNNWAMDAMLLRAVGRYSGGYEAFERYVKSCVYTTSLPTAESGRGGQVANTDPYGYTPFGAFFASMWTTHAGTLGLGNNALPVNTAVPTITGTAQVGQTLTASPGVWTNSPSSYNYQWNRAGVAISGATGITRIVDAADLGAVLSLTVRATNLGGVSAPATSANTATVIAAGTPLPVNSGGANLPAITGTAQVGQTLTASTGTWTNSPSSYTYQWNRNGVPISGATGSTRVVDSGSLGAVNSVTVRAINAGGTSAPATSADTATIIAASGTLPVNSAVPTITGTAQVGQTLTASTGSWSNSPSSYTYQWNRDGVAISGATGSTRALTVADAGVPITITVRAINGSGTSAPATSAPTLAVLLEYELFYPMTDLTNVTRNSSFAAYNPTPAFTLSGPVVGTTGGSIAALLNGQPSYTIRKTAWPFAGGFDTAPGNPASIRDTDLFVIPFEGAMSGGAPSPNEGVLSNVRLVVNGFSQQAPGSDPFNATSRGGRGFVGIGALSMRNTNWAGARLSSSAAGNVTIDVAAPGNVPLGQGSVRIGPVYRVKERFKSIIVFTYDDNDPAQYASIYPLMRDQGLPGSIYAMASPTNGIGSAARLSVAQCQEMKNVSGWSVNMDGHEQNWILMQPGTVAETLAAMNANADRLQNVLNLSSVDDTRHICYSFGPDSFPTGAQAFAATADGSNILTLSSGSFNSASGPMSGCYCIGTGVPIGARVVRMLSDTQVQLDTTVSAGAVSVRFSGGTAPGAFGHACVGNGTTTVTGIVTQALAPGMQMVGRDVPANTLITAVTIISGTSSGEITVSNPIPSGTVWANFFIPNGEWNVGKFGQAAYAAGFRTGRRTGSYNYGLCSQFGITPEAGFDISGPNIEGSSSTAAINAIQRNINDGNDMVTLSHGRGNFTQHNEVFTFVRARINAGELDCMNLTNWYNTISRRRAPV